MIWIPANEEPTVSNILLPKAAYRCLIAEASQHFKSVNNVGLKVVLQVVEHEPQAGNKFSGRKIFLYFTWDHPNEMAVSMGRRKLSDLLFAIGNGDSKFNSASEIADAIVDHELIANVKIGKRSDNGEDRNEVDMFFNLKGIHRGPKQTVKLLPWGGIEDVGTARGHVGGGKASAEPEDTPF